MTFIRQLNPRLALPAAAIAVILIAAAAVIAPNLSPPALAQSNSAAPANVAARNGANTGEVIVSWTPNAAAVSNRVGWANISEVQAAQAAGNWLEAFNFVEIGGAKSSYIVKRLEPGAQHAFIVATIAANGAFTYSEWVFLTTAAAPLPTPVAQGICQPPVLTREQPQVFEGNGDLLYSQGERVNLTSGRYEVVTEMLAGDGLAHPKLHLEGSDKYFHLPGVTDYRTTDSDTFTVQSDSYRPTGTYRLTVDAYDSDDRWRVTIRKTDDF